MESNTLSLKIRSYFDFLFENYGLSTASEIRFPEHFGNWMILLRSPDIRIRFLQDKGEIVTAFGPADMLASWDIGPWFTLTQVVAYLTSSQVIPEFSYGSEDAQLRQQAEVVRIYAQAIIKIFRQDSFERHRERLEQVGNELDEAFWKNITGPE